MALGWDLAGIVVDGGAPDLRAGERDIATSHQLSAGRGTWADLVALPAHAVAVELRSVTLAEAATLVQIARDHGAALVTFGAFATEAGTRRSPPRRFLSSPSKLRSTSPRVRSRRAMPPLL